jgi:hypothetical protein
MLPDLSPPSRAELAAALERLDNDAATPGDIVQLMRLSERLTSTVTQWRDYIKDRALERMQALKIDQIEDGPTTYYIGRDVKHKCADVRKALEAIMEATGGDLDAVAGVLSTNAFKPAAAMKTLGAESGKHFVTMKSEHLRVKSTKELE